MSMCSFGCGQPAIKVFKSGNYCCSKAVSSCPSQKIKNGTGVAKFIAGFDNPNDRWRNGHPKGRLGKPSGLKGKTIEERFGITKATDIRNKMKLSRSRQIPSLHSEATKARLSNIAKSRGLGGYIQGSGRGKKGRYRGFWCDSSYELAWVIYQLDHGIDFQRNTQKFPYTFEGKLRYWIPDFILSDGSYVEIKGYETEQSRAKISDFGHPILLLKEKDLQPIFRYVIDKYGSDFISLYG